MDIVRELLEGGQQQKSYEDFVKRYQQGPPTEGYSGQEAMNRYEQVVPNLPPQDFMQAAQQAFARMSPQEREQFARYVNEQAQQRNINIPQFSGQQNYQQFQNPEDLARATTEAQQQEPGLFGQLLGGDKSSLLNNPIAKAALAGITAYAAQQIMKRSEIY
jgi:hypothetical protein